MNGVPEIQEILQLVKKIWEVVQKEEDLGEDDTEEDMGDEEDPVHGLQEKKMGKRRKIGGEIKSHDPPPNCQQLPHGQASVLDNVHVRAGNGSGSVFRVRLQDQQHLRSRLFRKWPPTSR